MIQRVSSAFQGGAFDMAYFGITLGLLFAGLGDDSM